MVKWKGCSSRANRWVGKWGKPSEWKKAVDDFEAKAVREEVLKERQKTKKESPIRAIREISPKKSPQKKSKQVLETPPTPEISPQKNSEQVMEEIEEELAKIVKAKPKKRKSTRVKKVAAKKQQLVSNEEQEFTVEAILDHQITSSSVIKYLIKWDGYDSEMNTWEPEENLSNCPKLLQTYKEKWDISS